MAELFREHGLAVAAERREHLVFTARSPEEYLDAEAANHPMAIAAFDLLAQRGQAEAARERLLDLLRDHNEDEGRFRCTSRYVVLVARRG